MSHHGYGHRLHRWRDNREGPRCFKSKAERWAWIMAHCLGRRREDRGLTILPSTGARRAQIAKALRYNPPGPQSQGDIDERLRRLRADAKRGDRYARYVLKVAKLLNREVA